MICVFNEYVCCINELKDKDKNLDGNDICEGLIVIILVCILEEFF